MKEINQYISEKLKINKDVKNNNFENTINIIFNHIKENNIFDDNIIDSMKKHIDIYLHDNKGSKFKIILCKDLNYKLDSLKQYSDFCVGKKECDKYLPKKFQAQSKITEMKSDNYQGFVFTKNNIMNIYFYHYDKSIRLIFDLYIVIINE